jgi:hypothetical protein
MQIPVPICNNCKHFNIKKWNCKAFINGIPFEILNGENDHSKPLPEQENDIVFEPVDNRLTQ